MSKFLCTVTIWAVLAPVLSRRINKMTGTGAITDAALGEHMSSHNETNGHALQTSCQAVELPQTWMSDDDDGDDETERLTLGGIRNMDTLIKDNDVMTYAWGPAFKPKLGSERKIFAWGYYNEIDKKIKFWYPKEDHIRRDSSNKIGATMKAACLLKPSKCPDLSFQFPRKTFGPGGTDFEVRLAGYGTFEINQVRNRWRFTKPGLPGCFLDHVYACTRDAVQLVYAGQCGQA